MVMKPAPDWTQSMRDDQGGRRRPSANTDLVRTTSIPGLLALERPTYSDERGFFREVFHLDELQEALGRPFDLVQWNHSQSTPGVIRGQHAEHWNKLIYPVTGHLVMPIADIREDSETFGEVEILEFTDAHRYAIFISKGIANSFCVVGSESAQYLYLVDAYYDGTDTTAVAWDDPDLKIPWPIKNPTLSERDKHNPTLRELFPQKFK